MGDITQFRLMDIRGPTVFFDEVSYICFLQFDTPYSIFSITCSTHVSFYGERPCPSRYRI